MSMIVLALLAPSAAFAQAGPPPEFNAGVLQPTLDGERTLLTDDSSTYVDGSAFVRTLTSYSQAPLVYGDPEGELTRTLGGLTLTNFLAGYSSGRFRGGLDIPVMWLGSGDVDFARTGLGDIALDGKAAILQRDEEGGGGLALKARLALPTSTGTAPIGGAGPTWELALVGDVEVGKTLLAANVGTRGTPRTDLGDFVLNDLLVTRAAVAYAFDPETGAAVEVTGNVAYSAPLSTPNAHGVEWLGSVYRRLSGDMVLRAGGGSGLTDAAGTPSFRAILGIGYEPAPEEIPVDTDLDGLVDTEDSCPLRAEDVDGFEDTDGCPDPDNDGDGILDADDACVDVPEDADTWKDDDGCPDPEIQVTVRVIDPDGAPIELAKVTVGDAAPQAVPVVVETESDTLALKAAAAGFEALEQAFAVPREGAPVEAVLTLKPVETAVVVTRERIDLKESVYFETGRSTIKKVSYPLLDEVVKILKDYPEIQKLRIEGHTDSRGSEATNQRLSEGRAASVRTYLIEAGIDAGRLSSQGFGESKPLDKRENAEAWEKNRRVDFFVESWVDAEPAPAKD